MAMQRRVSQILNSGWKRVETAAVFTPLLGSPNGSGLVRMLIDHCDSLGHRTIASVHVLDGSPAATLVIRSSQA